MWNRESSHEHLQSEFPYLDGLEDNIQSKSEAEKHEPLTSLVNNVMRFNSLRLASDFSSHSCARAPLSSKVTG